MFIERWVEHSLKRKHFFSFSTVLYEKLKIVTTLGDDVTVEVSYLEDLGLM